MFKSSAQNSASILIVDDTPANLDTLAAILKDKGYHVRPAISGELALKAAQKLPPDLILLDVMMPDMDGYETCRRLKSNPITQDIPVIFLTALSDTTDKVAGFKVGAIDYISKPIEYEEMLARVHNQLKIRSLTKQVQIQNQELQELNQELEQRVLERTSQLSQALQGLKQAQVSLVQQEKMSALGELVAGIAHEINNPVSAITGNVKHLAEYTHTLIGLVQLYQASYPNPSDTIAQISEEADLEFMLDDMPKVVTSIQASTDRIVKIVRSVRHFSRRDETELQTVDIHDGLDSTLMILSHRLKGSNDLPPVKVIKEYGLLPLVSCYPGPLNQVFMNILANAIDSLEESASKLEDKQKYEPTIKIFTKVIESEGKVVIYIADNGLGMTEEVKQKLSEPMFTTKPIGKGTGLGLSISRQIIESKHGGKLAWQSELGQGAEFQIEIPIQQ